MNRRSAEFKISTDPRVLKNLRKRTREVLEEWGLSDSGLEAAVLVAHELVVNALLHTRAPATLRLILSDQLRIEVTDTSAQRPELGTAMPGELEHGLGLVIVETLSDAWGHVPTRTGKTVWCELLI